MKYWNGSEVEYMTYKEGYRVSPHKHPASICESDETRIEMEIVPNTAEMREWVSPDTFQPSMELCVQLEGRYWRKGYDVMETITWVPLRVLGYVQEPVNYSAFDNAMEIV